MRILVTGSTGFVGKHLCKRLVSLGHEVYGTYRQFGYSELLEDLGVTGYYCNLRYENQVRVLFEKINPEVIFHLAANPNTKLNQNDPNSIVYDNVIATHNLLIHCPNCLFVNTSSVLVYGDTWHKTSESDMCKPTSLYGCTKLSSENLVNVYIEYKNIKGINLRFSAIVGSGSSHGLLHDILRKAKSQKELNLIGAEPGTCKPYLHIEDAIDAYINCFNFKDSETFNICGQPAITVKEVAEIALKTIGKDIPITWSGETWAGDNSKILVDNSLSSDYFGWRIKYNSYEAIRKTVECQL